jgi:D-inositol-3-phosphate glycosyltransferase
MNLPTIAIIDPVGKKAGMDHYDLLLLEGIKKNGAEVQLYTNFSDDTSIVPVQHCFHNIGVSKFKAILSNFTGFIHALKDAKSKKVKWLILHVFRAGMFDLFTFSLARLMGFKICAIIHDIESLDTYTLPFVRRTVIATLPHLRTVHNTFSQKELQRSLNKPHLKSYVIPHVNFLQHFSARIVKQEVTTLPDQISASIPSGIPCFLFFGQIKDAKGLDILFEAACQVKGDFRLIIAGKVREGSWNKYEQMIRALNLQHKIIPVIRHITDEERDFLFANTKAVILPYKKIYQSGVLLMAMSFPCVIIASALAPNREIVQDNVNGLLFDAGSSRDLAQRMQELLNNQLPAEDLKKGALQRMEDYSPERIGRNYLKILG